MRRFQSSHNLSFPCILSLKEVSSMLHTSLRRMKRYSLIFIGNTLLSLTPWLIFIFAARVLSPHQAGLLGLALSLSAPIFMFTNLQLRTFIVVHQKNEFELSDYVTLRLAMGSLAILLSLIIGIVYTPTIVLTLFLCAVMRFLESFHEVAQGIYLRDQRSLRYFMSQLSRFFFVILFYTFMLYTTRNLPLALTAACIALVLSLIICDLSFFDKSSLPTLRSAKFPSTLLRSTLPLGIAVFLSSLTTNFPRYILENSSGEESLAYFMALFFIANGFSRISSSFELYYRPLLSDRLSSSPAQFSSEALRFFLLQFFYWIVVVLFLYFVGEQMLSALYGSNYSRYTTELLLISVAHLFLSLNSSIHTLFQVYKKFRIQAELQGLTLLITILGSVFLIPKNGLMGACYVVMLYSATSLIMSVIVAKALRNREQS